MSFSFSGTVQHGPRQVQMSVTLLFLQYFLDVVVFGLLKIT